ncbi:MAG TPA: response regulator [Gaiellaceae bacterium]|nr:response regulator [Gaiellaceae bacterium]
MAANASDHDLRPRVLLVDDDLALRLHAALLLSSEGFAPTAVADVGGALDKLRQGEIDLVLTDLVMPGLDGLDLLRALPEAGFAGPALAMTGSDDERLIAGALALGARSVLRKPLGDEELTLALWDALGAAQVA